MQEHSVWLNLMYHRLVLLKNLLHTEGSIWVSIDDDESHYLKVMMDEVFGRKNFVANVIWEKKYSPQNDAKWLSDSHDHILVYAKNKEIWRANLLPRGEKQDKAYKNADNDPRGLWKASDLTRAEFRERDFYGIETPSGKIVYPSKGRSWSRPKDEITRLRTDNRLWFGVKDDAIPSLKRFLTEVKDGIVTKTIWFRDEVGDNQEAKQETKNINEIEIFATPKPERLIERVLTLATKEGDIVLDSRRSAQNGAQMDRHRIGRPCLHTLSAPPQKSSGRQRPRRHQQSDELDGRRGFQSL
jgi:adenine-specific DNA-methyltransferase